MSIAHVRTAASVLALGLLGACSASSSNPTSPATNNLGVAAPRDDKVPTPGAAAPTEALAGSAQARIGEETSPLAGPPIVPVPQAQQIDSDTFETLPSGVVIDQRMVGGPAPGPALPKGTRVLHLGDSFAGALGIELNKVFSDAGVVGRLDFEKSTYIPTWAHNGRATKLISTFKPDLILVSLGANELDNPEPEKRAPLIQKIAKSFEPIPCVWIAPLLWSGAKDALLDVIKANLLSCTYLDSNAVVRKMPRAADKVHPSMAARPDWALATARWLAYHRSPTEQRPWTLMPASK